MLSGRPKKQTAPHSLQAAIQYFSDPDTCVDYMQAVRWPDGVTCPTCGETGLPAWSKFCAGCGAAITALQEGVP